MSTDLAALRDDPEFQQDVWITESNCFKSDPPSWMVNPHVRMGITAMHKVMRCREEERRLQMEAQNMLRWFAEELTSMEAAVSAAKGW